MKRDIEVKEPNNFEQENHFYPKALNSQIHPIVGHFLNLDNEIIINRYSHLNPQIDVDVLRKNLTYKSKHFYWGGADLFCVTTGEGNRKMVVLETNSCPSGQSSMPPRSDSDEYRGYRLLIENSFLPALRKKRLPQGVLAVIYDKNYIENSGYAQTLSDITGEKVYLIPHCQNEEQFLSIRNHILEVNLPSGECLPIRAAIRYVTQRPWNRIPIITKTFIYNPIVVDLAGGRNKLLANKAYDLYNAELAGSGLKIHIPETINDVCKLEIPFWVNKFGGRAVIKNPYSNAGQGVFTIVNENELHNFMEMEHSCDQFIIQRLIGHYQWSSLGEKGHYFHIGTVPNKKNQIFIADLRMMVYSGVNGFEPCAIYGRRARSPLSKTIGEEDSWNIFGTNLSIKKGENQWDLDTSRFILMDQKDFNMLGIGIDDLIEAYIQTVMSIIAIDKMAQNLITNQKTFRKTLFTSLNNDPSLINELVISVNNEQ